MTTKTMTKTMTIRLSAKVLNVSCACGQWKANLDLRQAYDVGGYEMLGTVSIVIDENFALRLASMQHPYLDLEITNARDE